MVTLAVRGGENSTAVSGWERLRLKDLVATRSKMSSSMMETLVQIGGEVGPGWRLKRSVTESLFMLSRSLCSVGGKTTESDWEKKSMSTTWSKAQ